MNNLWRCCFLALLLVGCASVFGEPPESQTAIKRYYEAFASEDIGQCLSPYIDGFTTIQVVEDDSKRMVLDVGYLYRDWIKGQSDQDIRGECVGYGKRRFVLTKSDGTLKVAAMSGPHRRPGPRPEGETASG